MHGARIANAKSTVLLAPFVNVFLNMVCAPIQLKLVHVGYQRPELMRDANGDYGWPVGGEGCFESLLDLFFCVGG